MKNTNYSREHLAYLKKERNKKIIITVSRILILLLLLGFWELFAQLKVIDPFITSSPSRVAITIADLYKNGRNACGLFNCGGFRLCDSGCSLGKRHRT